jgi:hypothetical protein
MLVGRQLTLRCVLCLARGRVRPRPRSAIAQARAREPGTLTQACARLLQGLAQLLQAAPQRGVRALRTRVQAADGWRTALQSQGRRTRCGNTAAPPAAHAGLPCVSSAVLRCIVTLAAAEQGGQPRRGLPAAAAAGGRRCEHGAALRAA